MTELPTILVVDDQEDNRLLLDLLLGEDYAVVTLDSGDKALNFLSTGATADLVLLDIMMPGMDGFEVCRQLKADARWQGIPVIFMSGFGSVDNEEKGLALGAIDFVHKPFSPAIVLARVRNQLALAETTRRLLQAEKLVSLGPIVAGVAHELNTPIGNCLVTASTLQEKAEAFEVLVQSGKLHRTEVDRFVADSILGTALLMRGLERSAALITRFKDVATTASCLQRAQFNLSERLAATVSELRLLWRGEAHEIFLACPAEIEMNSFPEAISQIVCAVATNAVEHAFAGRTGGTFRIEVHQEKKWVKIFLRDDGAGMAPEVRRRAFDPFFTTQLGKGSGGLGLYICSNLATGPLGGSVDIVSWPGEGTCLSLWIPCTAPSEEEMIS